VKAVVKNLPDLCAGNEKERKINGTAIKTDQRNIAGERKGKTRRERMLTYGGTPPTFA
jgi:hypothetical protein